MKICPLKKPEPRKQKHCMEIFLRCSRIMHAHSWRRTNEIISDTNLNYCEARPRPNSGPESRLKSRPCENSLADFCTLALSEICFFRAKGGGFLELSEVQKCKSPLENFYMVPTLELGLKIGRWYFILCKSRHHVIAFSVVLRASVSFAVCASYIKLHVGM
jgi:hypothetical protein